MAKKKKHEKEPNHERWLVSYADFITLLFAVFTTLYAMSQTDKKKVEEVVASLRASFGYSNVGAAKTPSIVETSDLRVIPVIKPEMINPGKNGDSGNYRGKSRAEERDFKSIKANIESYLVKTGAQGKVTVDITKRGLVVSLKEAGFFDSGSAAIKQSSLPLLEKLAESLSPYSNALRVEGHTDTDPISTQLFKSNWELSTTRATNIVHHLVNYYKFPPEGLSAVGYGEYRPVADNNTLDGKQKNRRVDLVLLNDQTEKGEP